MRTKHKELKANNAIVTSEEKLDAKIASQKINPMFLQARRNYREETRAYLDIGNICDQPECSNCHAHRWPVESKTNCCNNGKILDSVDPYKEPPAALYKLFENKECCKRIK